MTSDLSHNWEKIRILSIVIATIAVPVVVAVVGSTFSKDQKEKEISVRYVELATQILQAPPSAESKSLRIWAIAIIDHYAEIPLPEEAKKNLEFDALKVEIQKLSELQQELSNSLEEMDREAQEAIRHIKAP